jgi:hypothetical protein
MRCLTRLIAAAALLAACQKSAPAAGPSNFELTGACPGRLTLTPPIAKLTDVPARVEVTGCTVTGAEIFADMPSMPMGGAPVTLTAAGGAWTGNVVFSMSGAWFAELRLTLADGTLVTSRYDVSVP